MLRLVKKFQRPSDRDGTLVVKLDLHALNASSGGGSSSLNVPLAIKSLLGDVLMPFHNEQYSTMCSQ
jgi:hypothetical protein